MKDFYEAWNYLNEHVIFNDENEVNRFQECIDIEVVKVNPKTNEIDDDETKNTATRVWLECGPYRKVCMTHDIDLDCGAKTFEKAIVKLAKRVKKVYGNKKKKAIAISREKYPFDGIGENKQKVKVEASLKENLNEKQLKL